MRDLSDFNELTLHMDWIATLNSTLSRGRGDSG